MRSNLLYTGSVLFTKIVSPCVCTVWALYDLLLCESFMESLCWYDLRHEGFFSIGYKGFPSAAVDLPTAYRCNSTFWALGGGDN